MRIEKAPFGKTKDGQETVLFTLVNDNGFTTKITDYGATITSILTADKDGNFDDVVLGFDSVEGYQGDAYLKNGPYFGATIGRYGNRIAKGKFTLDGVEYTLAQNDGENHLHGGIVGFDKMIWNSEEVKGDDFVGVKFTYLSKDMEEGYPGNLNLTVVYKVTNDNEIKIEYTATTDKKTVLNLTNHSYFNLTGAKKNNHGHIMQIFAKEYTEVDDAAIPTGANRPVAGTPLDFTEPHTIGERIAQMATGYDHNFVLGNLNGDLVQAAKVVEPESGRVIDVFTTEPGVQFYSGWFLNGTFADKSNIAYNQFIGFCLETQHYPDSPNQPKFPSTELNPGGKYTQTTIYKFSA